MIVISPAPSREMSALQHRYGPDTMPLVRLPNGKLLYFAHVPKCAGTAVEHYLKSRFGALGLLDPGFGRRTPFEAWSLSPPQHMPELLRRELLPDTLFDGIFATIRHPAVRLRSIFLFQQKVENAVPATLRFDRWIDILPRALALDPYAMHGHLQPMIRYVPESAHVFRIEDGLDALVAWLDGHAEETDGPRRIATANVTAERLRDTPPTIPPLTAPICARIADLYQADYDRFGYDMLPDMQEGTP